MDKPHNCKIEKNKLNKKVSKKDIQDAIVSIEVINRYDGIYKLIDTKVKNFNTTHYLSEELKFQCKIRDEKIQKDLLSELYLDSLDDLFGNNIDLEEYVEEKISAIYDNNLYKKLQKLKDIDEDKYQYYVSVLILNEELKTEESENLSSIDIEVDIPKEDLIMVFGEDRMKELDLGYSRITEVIVSKFSEEEKERLYSYSLANYDGDSSPKTIIRIRKIGTVFVEIDLSQTKNEIIKQISSIKDKYDKGKIKDIYELLYPEAKKDKTKTKSFLNSMVDMLFIYDTRKLGYFNNVISQSLYDRKIKESNISNYYKFIKNIIDDCNYSNTPAELYKDLKTTVYEEDYYDNLEEYSKYE